MTFSVEDALQFKFPIIIIQCKKSDLDAAGEF